MLFTGAFERSVDEKLRIAIPKQFRDALGEPRSAALFVAPGTDGSLALYTEAGFAQMSDRLAESSPTQQDVRAFRRLFYAQAQRVDLDAQGRVRVPQELAGLAHLRKEAVLLGAGDHFELWDKNRWEAYRAEKSARYDQLAEAAFEPRKNSP